MVKDKIITNKNSELGSLFLFLLGIALCVNFSGCQVTKPLSKFVFSGPIMGTDFRITVVTDKSASKQIELQQVKSKVMQTMQAVNVSMSTYLPESELSLINLAADQEIITLSDALSEVIAESLRIAKFSQGAFDITIGPAVNLWGFGPSGAIGQKPSDLELLQVSRVVGYQKVSLVDNAFSKQFADTQLDLSAIAKGYAVDQVALTLQQMGIDNFLIDIGGELRAAGTNSDGQIWRVGIERPQNAGAIQRVVSLHDKAIATSGDYLNYVLIDGQRFSHTIDPQTLSPVLHRLALVSIIHNNTSTADALATALLVMGEDKAYDFAQRKNLAAYFIIRDKTGDGVSTKYTPQFAAYLK